MHFMFRPAGSRPARTSFHSAPRWRLPQLVVGSDHSRGKSRRRNRLACQDACPEPKGAGPRPCCCCLVGSFSFLLFFKKKIKPVDLSCGCEGCAGIVGRHRCPTGSGSESEPPRWTSQPSGQAGGGTWVLLGGQPSAVLDISPLSGDRSPQSSAGPSAQPQGPPVPSAVARGLLDRRTPAPFPRALCSQVPRENRD